MKARGYFSWTTRCRQRCTAQFTLEGCKKYAKTLYLWAQSRSRSSMLILPESSKGAKW